MPGLPYDAVIALVETAQKHFDAGDHGTAIAILGTFEDQAPDNYWLLLLLGRIRRARGEQDAAADCLRRAIALPTPERIGAFCELAFQLMEEQQPHAAAPLIDAALALPDTTQTRWYKARLLLMQGFAALAAGDPMGADSALADAYRFQRSVDEMPVLLPWVRGLIAGIEPGPALPYLRYLAARLAIPGPSLVYRDELNQLGPETRVVAIGAMDGRRFDELWNFIRAREWRAVLVEPSSAMFQQLSANYAGCPFVHCVRLAITEQNGPVTLHRVRPDIIESGQVGDWALGLSSLSLASTLKFYQDQLETETVPGSTFADFAAGAGIDRIDVLQIDTEGHDYAILKQVPLRRLGIRLLQVELVNVDPVERLAVFDMLREQGYRYSFDGNDLTAMLA